MEKNSDMDWDWDFAQYLKKSSIWGQGKLLKCLYRILPEINWNEYMEYIVYSFMKIHD